MVLKWVHFQTSNGYHRHEFENELKVSNKNCWQMTRSFKACCQKLSKCIYHHSFKCSERQINELGSRRFADETDHTLMHFHSVDHFGNSPDVSEKKHRGRKSKGSSKHSSSTISPWLQDLIWNLPHAAIAHFPGRHSLLDLLLVGHLIRVFMERKCLILSLWNWTNLPNLSWLMDCLRMLFPLLKVLKLWNVSFQVTWQNMRREAKFGFCQTFPWLIMHLKARQGHSTQWTWVTAEIICLIIPVFHEV